MSFSDLAGGAACGPSNPLQNLGKRFGQDRSSQMDRFGSAASGSRSSGFRASPAPMQQAPEEFARPVGPLDLSSLNGALPHHHHQQTLEAPGIQFQRGASPADFEASFKAPPPPQQQHHHHLQHQPQNSHQAQHAWSSDFLAGPSSSMRQSSGPAIAQQQQTNGQQFSQANMGPGFAMQQGHFSRPMGMMGGYAAAQQFHGQQAPHSMASAAQTTRVAGSSQRGSDDKVWTEAFTAYDRPQEETANAQPTQVIETPIERADMTPAEADELARTAGRLVSTVEHDQNDKFKQSNFLTLMRKIRDREAAVQGTDIVETTNSASLTSSSAPLTSDKGKERATDTSAPPRSQQEAYARMQARGQTGSGLQLPGSALNAAAQEQAQDRQWLNDMWAEEDKFSEAVEEKARHDAAQRQAFIGDGGDTAARMREDDLEAREYAKYHGMGTNVLGSASRLRSGWEEDDQTTLDEDFSNEDFVGRRWEGTKGKGREGGPQAQEWDKLQADWDAFEAGPHGLRPVEAHQPFAAANVPRYAFQANNPYLESTRNHMMHALETVPEDLRSILEAEAAVQVDPTDAGAWYSLGVKQQENERERAAIAALHRAIQINPLMKDAWLALAVSYTNESDRTATFESLERWIDSNERYSGVIAEHRAETGSKGQLGRTDLPFHERHARIVSTLLSMARHGSRSNEVDPDVQVALGVLFNASDEFPKAVDCFSAAISVRPDDWLLYNRLGAVLSNSGRSDEALHYYRYALELKPDFARCHFNLAISCLNLKMYADAASHCYTALALQDLHAQQQQQHPVVTPGGASYDNFEGLVGRDGNGSLWETLRVSLELMNRPDLAQKTYKRDVSLFDPADLVGTGGGADEVMEPSH